VYNSNNDNETDIQTCADIKFIAHAREDIPALLEYIGQLRAENAEIKTENEQWNDADCNTCPLRKMECCEQICSSKSSVLEVLHGSINYVDNLEAENAELRARFENAVKLLCAVGDTVYLLDPSGITATKIISVLIIKNNIYYNTELIKPPNNYGFEKTCFGVCVFLSRAEAETALNARRTEENAQ
jgi:hypothetical protein